MCCFTTIYLSHCPGGSSRAWLALVVGNPYLNRRDLEISIVIYLTNLHYKIYII